MELKNCPFCNEKPLMNFIYNFCWEIKCNKCYEEGVMIRSFNHDKELCLKQWNTRKYDE